MEFYTKRTYFIGLAIEVIDSPDYPLHEFSHVLCLHLPFYSLCLGKYNDED